MIKRTVVLGCALLSTVMLAGCGESRTYGEAAAAGAAADPQAQEATPASFEMTAELESKLAAADLVDGEQDHVVSRCPGCSLAMEGSQEYALPIGDYSLHFCSDSCLEKFDDDLEESVVALAIPEE